MLAAAHPPPELVQLGESEAVRRLNHHHGRVGYVDADLDHRRGEQDVDLRVAEAAHHAVLLGGGEAPMEQPQSQVGEDVAGEALVFLLRRRGLQLLRFLDQGVDHERLPALLNLAAYEGVGGVAALHLDPLRLDGQASGGHLVDGRDVEVAEDGEGEAAGDRRRGHH